MEDPEGALSFDFEGGLEAGPAIPSYTHVLGNSIISDDLNTVTPSNGAAGFDVAGHKPSAQSGGRSFRQTVCRHWLRSLCMKGDDCGFLHQYDKSRMPVCRFFTRFGVCREQDCVYKHTNDEAKECNMYKLGFCPNGPDCRYRHQKMPGPPPPVEEVFQKTQQLAAAMNDAYPNRYPQHKHNNYHQSDRTYSQQPLASASQRLPGSSPVRGDPKNQQKQRIHRLPQHQANQSQGQSLNPMENGLLSQPNTVSAAMPLPQGHSRYFIVKSSNRENLELSVQQGMWATQRNNEAKLNEAFDSCDNVILIFSINRTRHFQGCAKMMSKIGGFVGGGGWKYAHGTAHYGRNFSLKWLKLCELTFQKTRHLRNPYNENLPVKISRDCQELENSIGEQLASLLYLEPDSELMATACAVESKRKEEKTQGMNSHENEDPNIVPFEDNDDEQDDDESEEEESSSHSLGANQGRGRGRGTMWPPHGPMVRPGMGLAGSKPMGFHPVMVGGDGYGFDKFGMGTGEGFAMPDMFNAPAGPSQGFPSYGHPGPRFSGPEFSNLGLSSGMNFVPIDGPGSNPGMVFHGRPPPSNGLYTHGGPRMMVQGGSLGGNGPNAMMGAGRMRYMGGLGSLGRPNRSSGMPFRPPQAGNGGRGRKDQKRRKIEHSTDRPLGTDQRTNSKAQQMHTAEQTLEAETSRHQHQDGFGNNHYAITNDEDSESEDQAPRRSRHGESKKKRRDWDGEENGQARHWELPSVAVEPEDTG